ncbi:MAG: adenylate/guanylate cyclase domain-containing protein [Pseudomonadota bacterium]
MAADVVGYSRMMNEDHNRALDALRAVRDKIIEPSIAKSGGTVVKRLGDGWLAAFDAGTDACASALDIQKQLASDDSVDLRIGIHDGAVSFVDEDVFGTGVNIASRLEAIANPGGIAISDDVFENLPHNLQASFENAGARLLKNIEAPVTVWAFGGIPQTGAASEPISVLFEELAAKSASSELASDIPEAVAVELAKYRWLDVLRKDQDGSKSTYILGGTFRQSEDRVLITVTLSARHDGRRLWSERLDRVVTDDFELLDELGGTLALRISAEIDTYEKMRAKMRPPEQLNAAELSSRANDLMSSGHPDAFDEADAMLTRAVALEPRNPSVHIQKSFVGYRKAMSGAWPVDATLNAAVQSAMDAVRIDPKMPGGHVMLTSVYGMLGQTEAALDSAAQIEHLNPNAWGAPHGRSIAYTFASPEWAEKNDPDGQHLIANAEHTLALAKTSKFRSGHLFFLGIGQLTNSSAELQDAISTLERSAGATGANWWPSLFLILAALRQDNKQQAQQHVDTVCALFPGFSVSDAADIFERSRIWPLWKNEIEQLAHLEFPKARPITPSASL